MLQFWFYLLSLLVEEILCLFRYIPSERIQELELKRWHTLTLIHHWYVDEELVEDVEDANKGVQPKVYLHLALIKAGRIDDLQDNAYEGSYREHIDWGNSVEDLLPILFLVAFQE